MGDICEAAVEVIACVGSHVDNSKLVIDAFRGSRIPPFLDEGRKMKITKGLGHQMENKDLDAAQKEKLEARLAYLYASSDCAESLNEAISSFCNRVYWRRVWIVQEIRLARVVKLLCGGEMLDINDFAPVPENLANIGWQEGSRWQGSRMAAVVSGSHHVHAQGRSWK